MPLVARSVSGYVPDVPVAADPDSSAVPLAPGVNVMPVGNVPVSDNVGRGKPAVVMANAPLPPTLNVAVAALVIVGDSSTVNVNASVIVRSAFCAVSVMA